MMAALKVALSTSRSTGASVSPLLVARTAPEGKEKQRLALRKQVSFKTLSKLNSEDGVRELAKVWSGSNGDGEDEAEQNDQGPSPLQQTRSLLLQKKSVSFRLTKDTTPRPQLPHRSKQSKIPQQQAHLPELRQQRIHIPVRMSSAVAPRPRHIPRQIKDHRARRQ